MQQAIGDALQRKVSFAETPGDAPKVVIHLLGGIKLNAPYIEIGAPPWSQEPHSLLARNARMTLGYANLWRASRGQPLRIRELRADQLDGRIERLADGRASWQFGKETDTPDTDKTSTRAPVIGRLQVDAGSLKYRDGMLDATMDAAFSLVDGSNVSNSGPLLSGNVTGFRFDGQGSYQKQPLRITLATTGVLPVLADDATATPLPVTLNAKIGGAALAFQGTATDALHLTALKGRYTVEGPSLAAAGKPLNVTLPTTGPFRIEGFIAKEGVVWNTVVDKGSIGTSRLAAALTYDPRPPVPLLSGRLTGSKLALADLGPAVGAPAESTAAGPTVAPIASEAGKSSNKSGKVLPDREFDLPSLNAMNANVLVDIADLDLGSTVLEPLKPLRTHLVLSDGVLTLREFDARTGKGRLYGMLQLDGHDVRQALWNVDLRLSGVRLESWIHQKRGDGAPPYATGGLAGQVRVAGQGKSTAAILGSLKGGMRFQLSDGTVSHLAMEAAGLDIAQALGMLVKGDDALPVACGVADFSADRGVLTPKVFVLDTSDSTILIDGNVSLANEMLNLRVATSPKDFTPLSLRTPILLKGDLANPSVSVEKGPLAKRVGGAALLALLTPLAAIIPLIDTGDSADAKKADESCVALAKRLSAKSSLPSPAPVVPIKKPVS